MDKSRQQTAVEQLVNYMKENFHLTEEALEKFDEALQMEREQRINAQMDMFHRMDKSYYGLDYLNKREEAEKYAEDYYTQTYNQNK